jgi:hypothetical protein
MEIVPATGSKSKSSADALPSLPNVMVAVAVAGADSVT